MRRCLLLPLVVTAILATAGFIAAQAGDPPMVGTWKVNISKSLEHPGPLPTSQTQTVEAYEGGYRITQDSVSAEGKTSHSDSIVRLDGKEYPAQTLPGTTFEYRRFDAHSYGRLTRVNGEVTETMRAVVSEDGKMRTSVSMGPNFLKVHVWEKLNRTGIVGERIS